jgi:hypothetical protein
MVEEQSVPDDTQVKRCPVCECTPVNAWWGDARKEVDCPACGRFAIYVELNMWLWTSPLRDFGGQPSRGLPPKLTPPLASVSEGCS